MARLCTPSMRCLSVMHILRIVQPTAASCYLEILTGLSSKEIESMFVVPRVCTRDNVHKEFQFKILHRYLPTNDLLFKMEKVNSRKCTFCNLYKETILHLFYECYCVRDLWFQVQTVLERLDCSVEKLTCKDVILGYQLKSDTKLNVGVNNVILHVKSYIWKCKPLNLVPSYNKLVEYIGSRMILEPNLENLFENM